MQEIKTDYKLLQAQLKALTEDETHFMPNLSNASALLGGALKDINWVGFYLRHNGSLILGPFQGNTACIHIPIGSGVCGTAAKENRTLIVEDVHAFPGHIACDSASNSEIVVPIHYNEEVIGVLDVDSPIFCRFDEDDREGLEGLVRILEAACDWSNTSVDISR